MVRIKPIVDHRGAGLAFAEMEETAEMDGTERGTRERCGARSTSLAVDRLLGLRVVDLLA